MHTSLTSISIGLVVMAAAMGCEQSIEPEAQPGSSTVNSGQSSGQSSTTSPGQSSLGKAHQSAQNVVADLQGRSQEIADSIDE